MNPEGKLTVLRAGEIRVRVEKMPEDGQNSREEFLFLVRKRSDESGFGCLTRTKTRLESPRGAT